MQRNTFRIEFGINSSAPPRNPYSRPARLDTNKNGKTALNHAIENRNVTEDPGAAKDYTQMIEVLQKHSGRRGVGN